MKYGKNKIVSWSLGLILALSVSIANAEQEILPLDIFVYMDNSGTVYSQKGNQPTPANQLVKMLDTMFRQPLNEFGKPSFLGKGDRLYLQTFDIKVNKFKPVIDIKGIESWQDALGQLSSGSYRKSAPDPSVLLKTNMQALFDTIAKDKDLRRDDGRQKIVLIASDFINDTTNTSKQICDESDRIKNGKKASTYKTIERFSKAIAAIGTKETPMYLGFLEVSATATNSNYGKCLAKLLPLRPITSQLEKRVKDGTLTGDVIQFKPNQKDLGEFAATLMDRIVTATLPPATIVSVELNVGVQPQTVTLMLENGGLKSLNVIGVDYYTGVGQNAKRLHQSDLGTPVVIGKGEKKEVIAEAPFEVVSRVRNGEDVFVSIRDSSPITGERILRKKVPVNDSASIEVVEAFITKDRSGLDITAQVKTGVPKTPKFIVIRTGGNKPFGNFNLADSSKGPLKADDPKRKLPTMNLDGRISELLWLENIEVAIRDNNDQLSKYFKIKRAKLNNKPKIISAKWLEALGQIGKWKLEFEVQNPDGNPSHPLSGVVLMASVAGDPLYSCKIKSVTMDKGPSTVKSYCEGDTHFSSIEGVGEQLLRSKVIKVEIDFDNNERINLSNAIELKRPLIAKLIIVQQKTKIDVKDGRSILMVTVRNPLWFQNKIKTIEIKKYNEEFNTYETEIIGKEWISKDQVSGVYMYYDSNKVSDFAPRGKPFRIRVQNIEGEYSDSVTIENPGQDPLKVVDDKDTQEWSSKDATLKLRLLNDSGSVQKDPVFAVFTTRGGLEPLVNNLKPIEKVSLEKSEKADVSINFSDQNLEPIFKTNDNPFYICVTESSPPVGKDGCSESYRIEINPPNKDNGRIAGVVAHPSSGDGIKFSEGNFLLLDLENKDPYPVTVSKLRFKNTRNGKELESKLTKSFIIDPKNILNKQRVVISNEALWDKLDLGSVQLAINNFPFQERVSFDPISVKITGRLIQRLPYDNDNKYIARIDLEILNRALSSQNEDTLVNVGLLFNGVEVGMPLKQEVRLKKNDRKSQHTLYFRVEILDESDISSFQVEAIINGEHKPISLVSMKEVSFNLYAWSWKLSGFIFLLLAALFIYMQRSLLMYSWSRMKNFPLDEWGDFVKYLYANFQPFHQGSIAVIPTTLLSVYYWLSEVDPLRSAPKLESLAQPMLPVWMPFAVLVLFGIVFSLKINWQNHAKKLSHQLESNKMQQRIPISRMRHQGFMSLMMWLGFGVISAFIFYNVVFAPINSPAFHNWANSETNNLNNKSSNSSVNESWKNTTNNLRQGDQ